MKYVVKRTSVWFEENPRCPGAQKELLPQDGKLREAYVVELSSLEQLNQLCKEVKHPLILSSESSWGFDLPEIEIYDDYRE